MMKFVAGCLPIALVAFSVTADAAPLLHIPETATYADTVSIRVTGLAAGSDVTIRAERPSRFGGGSIYRSVLRYRADSDGIVDTATPAPVSVEMAGERLAADVFAPFWRMSMTADTASDNWDLNEVRVTVDIDNDGMPDLARSVHIGPSWADIVETPFSTDYPGAFIARRAGATGEDRPAVIVLGGSEGGDGGARAMTPALIEQGYVVLGLPYHSPRYFGNAQQFPELPDSFAELPVDYVEDALVLLRQQDGVNPDRIAIWGASKGAELALLTGSYGAPICAIAALVPSDVVWEGWGPASVEGETSGFSRDGEALPFVPYVGMSEIIARLSRGEQAALRPAMEAGRRAFPDRIEAARIRVENIDEPVFLVGGDRDDVWASAEMARTIAARRQAAGLETVLLTYPEGSHSITFSPFDPGSAADAAARREAYPAMLDFFRTHLVEGNCGRQS